MTAFWIWDFDAEEIRRIHKSGAAKRVKREWIKKGYDQQLSIYGVLTIPEADESGYKRIEILSNALFTGPVVALLYDFFRDFKPPSPYSIWLYDDSRVAVTEVGRYE